MPSSTESSRLPRMNPAIIRQCINTCRQSLANEECQYADYIANFLLAWSTWEALQTRFIRVAIHHQGWLIKDADTVLARARISSMSSAAKVLTKLQIKHPSEWGGKSTKTWNALLGIEPLRNTITHGFRTTSPDKLRIATAIVVAALEDRTWLSCVDVPSCSNGTSLIRIGSILEPRTNKNPSSSKSLPQLLEILSVASNGDQKRSPSASELQKILDSLTSKP